MSSYKKHRLIAGVGLLAVFAVAVSPVLVAYADTDDSTVMARVQPAIAVSSADTVDFNVIPTAGGVQSSDSDVVTVDTNSTTGYNLKISASDATTALTSGGNTIAASANTYAAPTTLANNTWGYAVAGGNFDASYSALTNASGSTTKWAGMPALASSQTIKTTATVASGDTTTVWYSAKATSAQPNGNYSDTVTYTATVN